MSDNYLPSAKYLDILDPIIQDKNIELFQYYEHSPQSQDNLNRLGGIIQIDANATDSYLIPGKSYRHIKGQLVGNDNNVYAENSEIALINNAMMYLFESISYQIGTILVETIHSPGQVSTIFGLLSYPDDFNSSSGLMFCWSKDTTSHANSSKYNRLPNANIAGDAPINAGTLTPVENPNYNQGFAARRNLLMSVNPTGHFSFLIPFDHIFGFGDYTKAIYNVKHSLKFTRKTSDNEAIHRANGVRDGKIKLTHISWRIPALNIERGKLSELRNIIENKQMIPVGYRARTTDSTILSQTREFSWRTPALNGVEKPRWIIIGFQTNKNESQEQNPAVFDHLDLTSACVKLNTDEYPGEKFTINFPTNDYSILYEMFNRFKKDYYGFNSLVGGTQVNFSAFKSLFPILVFDVQYQKERANETGIIDIQLKFSFANPVPANTTAYITTISDRMYHLKSDGKNLVLISK